MNLEIISKSPLVANGSPPLLFVHGAWHAAWCWDVHFLDYFVQHGFNVHAVSLRGHGGSGGREKLRWARIGQYVEDVARAADQLPSPPIVIGHSMGGHIVQKYLERRVAPAAVLLASLPPAGALQTTLRILRRHPWIFLKMNLTLSLRHLVATPELAREYFFSQGLSDGQLQAYWEQLQDESYMGFLDMLVLNLPKPQKVRTTMLVLGAEKDAVFGVDEVDATARAYNTKAEVFKGMGHDMMLEPGWQSVAERIVGWLNGQELRAA